MEMSIVINQFAVLFILMAVGYIASKANILTEEADKAISRLVLNISMPCTVLNSVMNGAVEMSGGDLAYFILMIVLTITISLVIAIPIARVPPLSNKSDYGLMAYMIAFGNVGFMGFPVAQSIFGDVSAFYVAMYNIPFTLMAFSIGIIIVTGKGDGFNLKVLLNPALIAGVITVLIFVSGIEVPGIIKDPIGLIGGVTTPCAMIVIGSTLARIPVKEIFSEWRLYLLTVERLLLTPFIVWLILKQIIHDDLMLGILVVLAAMPVASTASMLTMEYGGNDALASKGIFFTTLVSIVTIPLVVLLLLA